MEHEHTNGCLPHIMNVVVCPAEQHFVFEAQIELQLNLDERVYRFIIGINRSGCRAIFVC